MEINARMEAGVKAKQGKAEGEMWDAPAENKRMTLTNHVLM
jgi:hypothetical protein